MQSTCCTLCYALRSKVQAFTSYLKGASKPWAWYYTMYTMEQMGTQTYLPQLTSLQKQVSGEHNPAAKNSKSSKDASPTQHLTSIENLKTKTKKYFAFEVTTASKKITNISTNTFPWKHCSKPMSELRVTFKGGLFLSLTTKTGCKSS